MHLSIENFALNYMLHCFAGLGVYVEYSMGTLYLVIWMNMKIRPKYILSDMY